ncbi:hypothetical protein GCM10010182_67080 [Actinomadura cremea]|nr:hypothetical protein GCM10010182_67080 [Actinomadura cremea]
MIMINDDQHTLPADDPLALMRTRHLIAGAIVVILAVAGIILLAAGLLLDHVYTWTGGIGCILSGVGIAVYAGQVDTARLTLKQQAAAASQGETRDARATRFEGVIIARLDEIADGIARLDRQQGAIRLQLDAVEIGLSRLDGIPADVDRLGSRQDVLAEALARFTNDEVRKKREQRHAGG